MLEIILFVAACLVWQAIKDRIRGKSRESDSTGSTYRIRVGSIHAVAPCGCDMIGNDEDFVPCEYHRSRGGRAAFEKDQAIEKARLRIETIRRRIAKGGLSIKQMQKLTEELARLQIGGSEEI